MGKTAIVTGASRGLGRQIALELTKEGYDIVINYRKEDESLNMLLAEIEKSGQKAYKFQADISSFDQAKELVEFTVKETGSLDLLVNNAGITNDKLLARMSEQDFSSVIDINLKENFNCIRHE